MSGRNQNRRDRRQRKTQQNHSQNSTHQNSSGSGFRILAKNPNSQSQANSSSSQGGPAGPKLLLRKPSPSSSQTQDSNSQPQSLSPSDSPHQIQQTAPVASPRRPHGIANSSSNPSQSVPKASNSTPKTPGAVMSSMAGSSHVVKIMDQFYQFQTKQFETHLRDQCDFSVVGVLGLDGTGKSTILSELARFAGGARAHGSKTGGPKMGSSSKGGQPGQGVFRVQSDDDVAACQYETRGVKAVITHQRQILLDTQPLFSAAALFQAQTRRGGSDAKQSDQDSQNAFSSHRNVADMRALHMALWLCSACHVVLVVSDWLVDQQVWRLLRTVAMLQETVSRNHFLEPWTGTKQVPTMPDIVFVFNKVPIQHITNATFEQVRSNLERHFAHTQFRRNGQVANAELVDVSNSGSSDSSGDEQQGKPNVFFLPQHKFCKERYPLHDDFHAACRQLATQVFSMPKRSNARPTTEREWLRFAAKFWSDMVDSRTLADFNLTLQKLHIYT